LLDRTTKRKSGWLPSAFQLAEVFQQTQRKLSLDIENLQMGQAFTHLRIGALEGLSELAIRFCHRLFDKLKISVIELDVFDIMEMESLFESQKFDVIFTFREIGKKKYRYSVILGYQELTRRGSGSVEVVSPFEYEKSYGKPKQRSKKQFLISNSLNIRKTWIESKSGAGIVPSEVRPPKNSYAKGEVPVLVIGSELLTPNQWQKIAHETFAL
jgi:LysR family transcriptional regulator, transcriptional activator for aaeXAB operon